MRLHSLKVENITSLKGKHEIDLDQFLDGEDLFAITGPTGSGKSSILTAISLALYSNNHKNSLSSQDFVTIDAPHASTELVFSVANKKYHAFWSCRIKKKNGEPLKQPKVVHELFHEGEALSFRPEQILNLTFDQFCKTIILNQGQFSRFLTSNFSERKDILEKISNGDELTILNKTLKNKLKNILLQLEKKNIESESTQLYTQDEIDVLKNEDKVFTQKIKADEQEDIQYQAFKKNIEDLKEITAKEEITNSKRDKESEELGYLITDINKKKVTLKEIQIKQTTFEKDFQEKLPSYTKALTLSQELARKMTNLERFQEQHNQLKETRDKVKQEAAEIRQKIKNKGEERKQLRKETFLADLTADTILIAQKLMDKAIPIHQELQIHIKSISTFKEQLSKTQIQSSDLKKKIHSFETSKYSQKDWLPRNQSDQKKLREQRDKLLQNWSQIERYYDKVDELQKSSRTENIPSLEEQSRLLEEKVHLEQEKLVHIEHEIKLNAREKALQFCHKESRETGICIICNNPYNHEHTIKNAIGHDSNELDEKVKKTRKKLSDFEKELQVKRTLLAQSQEAAASVRQEHDKYKGLIDEELNNCFSKKFESKQDAHNYLNQKLKEIEISQSSLRQEEKIFFEQQNGSKIHKRNLQEVQGECQKLEKSLNELNNLNDHKQKELDELISKFKSHISTNSSDFKEIQSTFHANYKKWQLFSELQKEIISLEEVFKVILSKGEEFSQQINKLENTIKNNNLEIEEDENLINDLCPTGTPEIKLNELKKISKELKDELEDKKQKLATIEKKRDHSEGIIKSLDDQLNDIKLARLSLLSKLQSQAKTITDLKSTVLSKNALDKALHKINQLNLEDKTSLCSEILNHLHKEFISFYDVFKEDSDKTKKLLIAIREKLNIHSQQEQKRKEIQEELSKLTSQRNRWKTLEEIMIGPGGKDEFRNFVLGLIEEQLIRQTNQELDSLCDGRYILKQEEATRGHDFYIVDRWRGGLQRKVSTLSGGETFLISLGMALSLAEMTRGHAEIDSFFIDEGFGSLDQDSIDEVLEVLMNVRNRGKQIGLISHIKALTDRIPANIVLEKSNLGNSQIKMAYN